MRKFWALLCLLWALPALAQQYVLVTQNQITWTPTPPTIPAAASAQGFNTLTFTSTTFSATNVDKADSCWNGGAGQAGGAGACPQQWFPYRNNNGNPLTGNGNTTTPGSCLPNIIFSPAGEPAGVMELDGCKTGPNGQLATVMPNGSGATTFRGSAFGGGGYFEVEMKFVDASYSGANGWPAWWAQPYTTTVLPGASCPDWWGGSQTSSPCYHHNIEIDAMEYIASTMGLSLHESYGVYNVTCAGFCQQNTNFPSGSFSKPTGQFGSYHKYGWLWVAATATTSGYIQGWRDGAAQTRIYWPTLYSASFNPPPPTIPATVAGQNAGNTWAFGAIDSWQYGLILGTGIISDPANPTPNPKIYIKQVNVWQANGASNVSN